MPVGAEGFPARREDPERTSGRTYGGSAIPGLYDDLARDLSTLQVDHRRAEHFRPIRIRTALCESQTVAYGHTGFDFVSHVASADIFKIRGDGALALQMTWFARWIVTIDDLNDGIVSIKTGKRRGLAPLDRAPKPRDGDWF